MKINVPLVDQRHEVGGDGKAPEDGNQDCVPASLAGIVRALAPGARVTGDGLHDAAYGDGYVGMQDPARYVSILEGMYHLRMVDVTGTAPQLVARAVAEIGAGHPVLINIPSDWGDEPPTSPYAHTVAGCDVPSGETLTAMNPWTVTYQTQTLAWWTERIAHCSYQHLWVVEREGETEAVAWHQQKDGTGRDDKGHNCGPGDMAYLAAHGLASTNGLLSETFYDGNNSFLPLDNGRIVTAHHASGKWTTDEQGAQALVAVWQQLQAAQKAAQAGQSDPQAEAALKLIKAVVALGGQK